MALQTSGAISLNDIHVEAGGTTGTQASINDADIIGLISKSSGAQMSFSEWYGASAFTPFDWPNVTFSNVPATAFINTAANTYIPNSIRWGNSGNTLFLQRYSLPWIYWSNVSSAYDWSTFTGSFSSWTNLTNYLPSGANTSGNYFADFTFKPDGTKMYVLWSGDGNTSTSSADHYNYIIEINLNTAWTPSSVASGNNYQLLPAGVTHWPGPNYYGPDGTSRTSSTWDHNAADSGSTIQFKSDGTKAWICCRGGRGNFHNNFIYQYTLSTAWDLSTLTADHAIVLSTHSSNWYEGFRDVFFRMSDDGTRGFYLATYPQTTNTYCHATDMSFSTAYDIASYTSTRRDLSSSGVSWANTGFNTLGTGSCRQFYQNTSYAGNGFEIVEKSNGSMDVYTANSAGSSGGTSTKRTNVATKYNLGSSITSSDQDSDVRTVVDLNNAAYAAGAGSYGGWSGFALDSCMKDDGTRLYMLSGSYYSAYRIYQFSLSTPWDIATATPVINPTGSTRNAYALPTSVGGTSVAYASNDTSFDICDSGTKIVAVVASGTSRDLIYGTMSTAWDLSTISWQSKMNLNVYGIAYFTRVKINHNGKVIAMTGHQSNYSGYARIVTFTSTNAYDFANPSNYTALSKTIVTSNASGAGWNNYRSYCRGMSVDPQGGGCVLYLHSNRWGVTQYTVTNENFLIGSGTSPTGSDYAPSVSDYFYPASTSDEYRVVNSPLKSDSTKCIAARNSSGGTTYNPHEFVNFEF